MKKIIFLLSTLLMFSLVTNGQDKKEKLDVVKYVSEKINEHVQTVLFRINNDTTKIFYISTYDILTKTNKKYYAEDIKIKYPNLYYGFLIDNSLKK